VIHKQVYGDNNTHFAQTWCGFKWNHEVKTSGKWEKVTCPKCIKLGAEKYGSRKRNKFIPELKGEK
jgi:hypothetical protein